MQKPTAKLQILIQDRRSRLYFAGVERWTADRSQAIDFKLLESARNFIHAEPLPHARIVPRFARH